MMDYVMLTLRYQQQEADLELPTGVPLFNLVPIVMSQLSWHTDHGPDRFVGRLGSIVVRPYETLAQTEVPHGAVLELVPVQGELMSREDSHEPVSGSEGAFLKSHGTGVLIPLRSRSALIGRSPNCAINLESFPNSDVVSSQHANLVRRDDGYWLTDTNSTNGTIVDGVYLQPGEWMRLRDGSQIQFGETGPLFVFYAG